jgi:hypothetical protein
LIQKTWSASQRVQCRCWSLRPILLKRVRSVHRSLHTLSQPTSRLLTPLGAESSARQYPFSHPRAALSGCCKSWSRQSFPDRLPQLPLPLGCSFTVLKAQGRQKHPSAVQPSSESDVLEEASSRKTHLATVALRPSLGRYLTSKPRDQPSVPVAPQSSESSTCLRAASPGPFRKPNQQTPAWTAIHRHPRRQPEQSRSHRGSTSCSNTTPRHLILARRPQPTPSRRTRNQLRGTAHQDRSRITHREWTRRWRINNAEVLATL